MAKGRNIAVNRQASYDYEILDRYEAGLVLTGSEIKSVRSGRVDLRGCYARPQDGELWIFGMHIATYDAAGVDNHDPRRPRKLLMHKKEIVEAIAKLSQKGLTMVPLRVYVKSHWAKVEVGLAKGKRKYEKRRAIIDRDRDREARQALRRSL